MTVLDCLARAAQYEKWHNADGPGKPCQWRIAAYHWRAMAVHILRAAK